MEKQSIPTLVEDALRLHAAALARHQVRVVRQFDPVPDVLVDKHKILQILVNLISNAKYALSESTATERRLALGVKLDENNLVRVSVADNGVGIPHENLVRIFSLGFTTRQRGHGLGLHSGFFARPGNGRCPCSCIVTGRQRRDVHPGIPRPTKREIPMKTEHIENNRRILIIDDSQSIQADFRKILAASDSEDTELITARLNYSEEPLPPPGGGILN